MRVAMDGYSLALEDGGQGTPVLLLHGFPMSSAAFAPIRPRVERAARLITIDLRGFGASDTPPGPYDMSSLADDVVRIADHLGLERFVLGGHSMGGYVAFRIAASQRDRLSGLILIDTRAAPDTAEGVERRRAAALDRDAGQHRDTEGGGRAGRQCREPAKARSRPAPARHSASHAVTPISGMRIQLARSWSTNRSGSSGIPPRCATSHRWLIQ